MQRAPHDRGLRLDGPIQELHRAVDRLRWDTVPTLLDHPNHKPADPSPPPGPG
jgi:hypothetical protein